MSKETRRGGMKLDFIDVRRAYFHAEARRQVFVEVCAEDDVKCMCGELVKAMYGTRDAAQNWEVAYVKFMTTSGSPVEKRHRACSSMKKES